MQVALLNQLLMDIIQDTVYKLAALLRTVFLGYINVFVNGHFGGNGLEIKKFGNTHFHDDHFGGWYPGCPMSPGNKYALSGITGVASLVPVGELLTRDFNYPAPPEQILKNLPKDNNYSKGWASYMAFIHHRESTGALTGYLRAGSATQNG